MLLDMHHTPQPSPRKSRAEKAARKHALASKSFWRQPMASGALHNSLYDSAGWCPATSTAASPHANGGVTNGSIACSPMKQPFWSLPSDKRARGARFLFRMQEQSMLLLKSGDAEAAAAHADECAAFVTRNYGASDPRMLFPLTLGAQAWETMGARASAQSLAADSTLGAAERGGQAGAELNYRLDSVLALTAQHEPQHAFWQLRADWL